MLKRFTISDVNLSDAGVVRRLTSYNDGGRLEAARRAIWRECGDAVRKGAYSDEAGHLFRHEAGRRTDLKPASILI